MTLNTTWPVKSESKLIDALLNLVLFFNTKCFNYSRASAWKSRKPSKTDRAGRLPRNPENKIKSYFKNKIKVANQD